MTEIQDNQMSRDEEATLVRENRKRIAKFVIVFVVTVLALLTSYRYAIHTRLNDWYLFQAAAHTTWTLDKVGHAQLEPLHYGRQNPAEVRAKMAAWQEGRDHATRAEIDVAPTHPLNAWERWSYRAIDARRTGPKRINGPRVYFVLRPGISSQIDALNGQLNIIEGDITLPAEEKAERLVPLQEELKTLREKQHAIRTQDMPEAEDTSLIFPFILVPECGAIEIMAIFLAAVLAFPTLWWKRLVGLAAGLPIMYAVNIFRLTVLAVIGAMDKSRVWFNFAHEYVWQAVYIIFVVLVWLIWVEYVVKRNRS